MSLNRSAGHCFYAQIGERSDGVGHAGGLPDPSDHQIANDSAVDDVDGVSPDGHPDIEDALILGSDLASTLQQDPKLPIRAGSADVTQNCALTSMFTHGLHRHRTRGHAHLPHLRHRPNLPA